MLKNALFFEKKIIIIKIANNFEQHKYLSIALVPPLLVIAPFHFHSPPWVPFPLPLSFHSPTWVVVLLLDKMG